MFFSTVMKDWRPFVYGGVASVIAESGNYVTIHEPYCNEILVAALRRCFADLKFNNFAWLKFVLTSVSWLYALVLILLDSMCFF